MLGVPSQTHFIVRSWHTHRELSCSEARIIFFFRRYPIAKIARRAVSIPTGNSNFSTISLSVKSGCSSIVFAICSRACDPNTLLRPFSQTHKSTLPVLTICSASRSRYRWYRYSVGQCNPFCIMCFRICFYQQVSCFVMQYFPHLAVILPHFLIYSHSENCSKSLQVVPGGSCPVFVPVCGCFFQGYGVGLN